MMVRGAGVNCPAPGSVLLPALPCGARSLLDQCTACM